MARIAFVQWPIKKIEGAFDSFCEPLAYSLYAIAIKTMAIKNYPMAIAVEPMANARNP